MLLWRRQHSASAVGAPLLSAGQTALSMTGHVWIEFQVPLQR